MKREKMLKNYLMMAVLVFMIGVLSAQGPGGPQGQGMPKDGKIIGVVYDQDLNLPMEYANAVLFSVRDSSMVAGTVTGPDGKFILEELRYGQFYLIVNFIGYDKKVLEGLKLNSQQNVIDLGRVDLKTAATNLEGVKIEADKDHVQYKIDKKIVNVSQDLMSSGNTAVSVLENVPSVNVDIEGNVSLRGTSNFNVLIDGRPSVLSGADALEQIPASTIDHIEIITNPSVKYDPDGVGGIINVILKQNKLQGFSGVINTSIGTGNKYRVDGLLSYRTRKFNIFGGLDYSSRQFAMEIISLNTTYGDTLTMRESDKDGTFIRNGYGVKGGFDYYVNKNSTLSFNARYGNHGRSRDFTTFNEITYDPAYAEAFSKSLNTSGSSGDFYSLNLNYTLKFEDPGHQLDVMADFSNRSGTDEEEQNEYDTDENFVSLGDEYLDRFLIDEIENSNDFRFKADYTKPIGEEGKFEAGLQSRMEYEDEDYLFYDYDIDTDEWVENADFTNNALFSRNIFSLYGLYANQWNNLGAQLGLRGELTDRSIENALSDVPSELQRIDYFPSAHFSYQLPWEQQVFVSYTRRIDRPRGRELDPLPMYYDSYNMRVGNPDLKPEYTDAYEAGYQKKFSGSFVSFEGYYRKSNNKITRITELLDDGTMLHTSTNLNYDLAIGGEMMLNLNLAKWFNLNSSLSVYDYTLVLEDSEDPQKSTNWYTRTNITLKFPANFSSQISGYYRGPSVTAQGEVKGSFMSSLALRKDFFDRKLKVTLSGRDLLGTFKREMIYSGEGYSAETTFVRESQVIMLNLSYIINNYKTNKRNSDSNDMNGNGDMDMY